MLILIIVLLTLMSISLRIAQSGVELSYQVGKRADAIRRKSGKLVEERPKNGNKRTHKLVKTINFGLNTTSTIASPVVSSVKTASILGLKGSIKILRFIISRLRDLLVIVQSLVLIIDIIVALVILSAVSYYLLLIKIE